jgi:hypothetical protein
MALKKDGDIVGAFRLCYDVVAEWYKWDDMALRDPLCRAPDVG